MNIYYADRTNDLEGILTSVDFQPSNDILVYKTFSIIGYNTAIAGEGLDIDYYIGIEYDSSFSDGQLHWYLKRLEEETIDGVTYKDNKDVTATLTGEIADIPGNTEYTGYNHGTFNRDDVYIKLVTGTFKPSKEKQFIGFNLKIQFPDTGENQDENKGATFTGKIIINEEKKSTIKRTGNMVASLESRYNSGDTDLMKDDTEDANTRYAGSDPNNYVSFNNELWRIIGVFDTYDSDDDGNTLNKHSKKIKLIRAEELGEYSFMSYEDENTADLFWVGMSYQGYTVEPCALNRELNGDYLNPNLTSNPNWFYYDSEPDNFLTKEFDRTKALSTTAQSMISNEEWKMGFIDHNKLDVNLTHREIYNMERNNYSLIIGEDTIFLNPWNGKVGLMYASDYLSVSNDTNCNGTLG